MRLKILLSVLILSVFASIPVFAGGDTAIKGSYVTVAGQEFRYDGKVVEVVEFMSFYCDHCYKFEKSIPVIKGNFPKKVKWTIVPIYWGEGSSKPGEAYFLAEDAGKGRQMINALFRANFIEQKDIGSVEVLESIAARIGMGFDFSRRLRSGEKAQQARKALDLARVYRIDETPTLIIAGNIKTNSHETNHDIEAFKDNVITIIKSILK